MIAFEFLETGISGIANAHKAGTMAGHLGASVVAGYFFGEDQALLDDAVYQGVEAELRRIIAGEESFWWNVKQTGVTSADLFQSLPKGEPAPQSIKRIAEALQKNIGQTRQSGHNVIFAAIALRALHDHSDFATPQVIDCICKLTAGFNTAHAGRGYYGKEKGWLNGNQVTLPPDPNAEPYRSIQELVDATIAELIAAAAVKKQGFGGLWHLLNHAAGIVELDRCGYQELAQLALPAHFEHLRLWRSLPEVESELGAMTKSTHDPRDPEYWKGMLKRDEARLTHRIKTLYGYHTLRNLIDEKSLIAKADDAFLYLMS